MKTRSSCNIWLPIGGFAVACLLSVPTLVLALAWLSIGVCAIGYRSLDTFPVEGFSVKWLCGRRRACLWFHHLLYWPRHIEPGLQEIATRTAKHVAESCTRSRIKSRSSADLPSGNRKR
ncbi:hypothetical protein [Paraburkholderia acidipaludis]|uniref:hypothetical protein n=1 Tax=Paraburkholderia acidipaludis TaxID=660537 RepID=UPI0012ECA298|nr:hypothetical protein [Paraburkholderia acidipaludis]